MHTAQNKSEAEPVSSKPANAKHPGTASAGGPGMRPMHYLMMLASLVVIIAGMRAASFVLAILLLAAFVAAICTVPLAWLRRRGVSRMLAVGIIAGGIIVSGLLLVVLVASSVNSFLGDLPKYQESLSALTTSVINWLNSHGVNMAGEALRQHFNFGKIIGFIGLMLSGMSGVITGGFLVFITVIFILLEASGFPVKLRAALTNPEQSLAGLRALGIAARRYFLIKILLGAAEGVAIGFWLWILGVQYAFLWGFLAFLLNFVPYIGGYIAAIPALLLAIVDHGVGTAVLALLGYITVNVVFAYLVEPRLMGAQLGLSSLVVFTSMLIWGWLLGPVGIILAVPLTVLLRIALETNDDTRWIAILIGPEPPERNVSGKAASKA